MNEKIKISADGGGTAKILRAFQGEHNARTYQIEIDAPDGQQIDLSGTTAMFYISEKDKVLQLPMTISENLASVTLTNEACRYPGDLKCWIQIVKPQAYDLRVDNLILRVFPCKIDEAIPDDGEVPILYQLISETKKATQSANQAAEGANAAAKDLQLAVTSAIAAAQSEQNAKSSEIAAEASADKAMEYTAVFKNSGYHNSVYRGKDISPNEADGSMYTNIANGTFDDIFVGDYFTKMINGTSYVLRVAGCDSYLNRGDTALTTHHIVVVPDAACGTYPISDTGTIDGGYVGSKMYTDTLPLWAGYLSTAFGTHLLTLRELFVNSISSNIPSDWSWYDSKVGLMTSEEVAGCGAFGLNTSGYPFNIGIAYGQLPLFRLSPDKICIRHMYWLRNIVNVATFVVVNDSGELGRNNVANYQWLRPRFLLG